MEKLTLDQLRDGLDWLIANQKSLREHGEMGMVAMLEDKIDAFKIEITGRITMEDPYTTAADVAYFEGWTA